MTYMEAVVDSPSDDHDVEVTITTNGDETAAESVHTHAHDQVVRAMQALMNEQPPEECDGFVGIDWERRFEIEREEGDAR